MKMIVRKWGKSAAVRIPASVMAAASLDLDQIVDVREEGGRVVIGPVRAEPCDLNGSSIGCVPKPSLRTLILGRLGGARFGEARQRP